MTKIEFQGRILSNVQLCIGKTQHRDAKLIRGVGIVIVADDPGVVVHLGDCRKGQ